MRGGWRHFILMGLLLALALLAAGPAYTSVPARFLSPLDKSLEGQVSPKALRDEIFEQRRKVEFFEIMRDLAQREGVRLWLLGGAAAQFGHYVRWDMLRRGGDSNFRSQKFNYEMVQIFRAGQDFDLVIDGNDQAASRLERQLREKFPHFRFDISLTKLDRPNKMSILGWDYQNQNSDSQGVGMIELTDPISGESVVRSAFDFKNQEMPLFLSDMASAQISFLPNSNHRKTSRYVENMNPEFFSVIRYLIKALSLGLRISPVDYEKIKAIGLLTGDGLSGPEDNSYVRGWIRGNGSKLARRSIEYRRSRGLFESLSLFENLWTYLDRETQTLLMREPLDTVEPSSESFATVTPVAHDTTTFWAYEAMTASPTRSPNLLISREKQERAAHGDGFYVRVGDQGAWSTPHTVQLEVSSEQPVPSGCDGVIRDLSIIRLRDIDDTAYRQKYFRKAKAYTSPNPPFLRAWRIFNRITLPILSTLLVSTFFWSINEMRRIPQAWLALSSAERKEFKRLRMAAKAAEGGWLATNSTASALKYLEPEGNLQVSKLVPYVETQLFRILRSENFKAREAYQALLKNPYFQSQSAREWIYSAAFKNVKNREDWLWVMNEVAGAQWQEPFSGPVGNYLPSLAGPSYPGTEEQLIEEFKGVPAFEQFAKRFGMPTKVVNRKRGMPASSPRKNGGHNGSD